MATDEARVLTIRQPWAWAIIYGGKDVENRSWFTKHRGPLLVHAGRAFDPAGYETVKQHATHPPPPPGEFIHGAIIGVVELVDCLQSFDSEWAVAGRWHWLLRNPRSFGEAVPCSGRLGLWRPPRGVTW